MPTAPPDNTAALAFISRWRGITASELATAQSFVIDLCALLGVDKPHPTPEQDYMFERPVTFAHRDGTQSAGRIDCYKRGHFVLEAKKLKVASHTKGFDDGMIRAHAQAQGYMRALPSAETRPPFILVLDVGTVIEVYAEFSQSGGTYTPFPDSRSFRIRLDDLALPAMREQLRRIWQDPASLDPARISARVTRQVSDVLARLAKSIEGNPVDEQNQPQNPSNTVHVAPEKVASFLTRCLFSMFAEDVGLLPKEAFLGLLKRHRADPPTLRLMLQSLWADMDRGGFSPALATKVLHFNGKLFKQPMSDGYSLLLTPAQIDLLIDAADTNWRDVEPAIFGTLLERALKPAERHALGAHYTPRAYVERLVLPTVIEPLRAEWADTQAAALVLAHEAADLEANPPAAKGGTDAASFDRRLLQEDQEATKRHAAAVRAKWREASQQIKTFHHRLCTLRVLDPACGSANFLYVTLEHLKRLEGEVLNQLGAFGDTQDSLTGGHETVNLQQLRGIELNEWAAAIAELVLWIGWLQWHIRTQGNAAVAEPVVHDYHNIECRDAVLAWDTQEPAYDAQGRLLSRWDGATFKTHPVTAELVPDEAAQVPQWRYLGARQAVWPQADFVVGNPPFIGASAMRLALGDGYVQALRAAWPQVPESADFVMYWWARAAALVAAGQTQRMGLITTNSLRQTFNRRAVQAAFDGTLAADAPAGVQLVFAIPDHPWVDSADGAAVRIAMTVVQRGLAKAGRLLTVTDEQPGPDSEVIVTLVERLGLIHADLSVGANVTSAVALRAMSGISSPGVKLHGAGFIVTPEEAAALGHPAIIKDYRNGRDLTDRPRGASVIDAFGLTADELRTLYPAVYQWLLERVKPERDAKGTSKDGAGYAKLWWLHGKPRTEMRKQLAGLTRYIATVETAKHRLFQFLAASILPDNMLIAIASDDAFHLGVLSSAVHEAWALAQGGTLEDRPRYNKSRCFETFPFPGDDTGLTPELRHNISHLAEQIDAHRKRVLELVSDKAAKDVTLTGLYNVLQALREGRALTAKEKQIHSAGLVSVLKTLHDELDTAVLQAYGWADVQPGLAASPTRPEFAAARDTLLLRLVALNAHRAAEEGQGQVRWLRPAFQNPLSTQAAPTPVQQGLEVDLPVNPDAPTHTPQPWPATLPEQVKAVAQVLASSAAALTLAQIEARFAGRSGWRKTLPTLLQTLEALGRAQQAELAGNAVWRT